MNESVTIGHPSEFFRELKKSFSSIDARMKVISEDKKLELDKTPLEGVAKFDEQLRGRCYYHVVELSYQVFGVAAICGAVAGVISELFFLSVQNLLYYPILGGLIALFVAGGLALGVSIKHYVADLFVTLEGEAYQAKTIEPQGERASVFSRAFLRTDWQPIGGSGNFPIEFTKRMEENKLKLDLEIARLLSEFDWEKSQIPKTEKLHENLTE